jgi:hypothetical protein
MIRYEVMIVTGIRHLMLIEQVGLSHLVWA